MSEIRPIDANKLMELIETRGKEFGVTVSNRCTFRDILKLVPTLECEVVKHSNWKLKNHRYVKVTADGEIHCPECHSVFTRIVGTWFKRCPECGAKMDGGEDNA